MRPSAHVTDALQKGVDGPSGARLQFGTQGYVGAVAEGDCAGVAGRATERDRAPTRSFSFRGTTAKAARDTKATVRSTHPRIGSRLLPICSLRHLQSPHLAGFRCGPLRALERQKPLHKTRIRGPAQRPLPVETAGIEPASAIA
jgi:hypothetical protein